MVQPHDIPPTMAQAVWRGWLRLPAGEPFTESLQKIIADSLNGAGLSVTPATQQKEPR
jgi:hypothetical protein